MLIGSERGLLDDDAGAADREDVVAVASRVAGSGPSVSVDRPGRVGSRVRRSDASDEKIPSKNRVACREYCCALCVD